MLKRSAIPAAMLLIAAATAFVPMHWAYKATAQEQITTSGLPRAAKPTPVQGYAPAEQPFSPYQPVPGFGIPPTMANYDPGMPAGRYRPVSPEDTKEAQEFQTLLGKLRNPGPEDSVDEIREALKVMLNAQLERDLAQREEDLKEIERRASELRAQLDARRESKPETLKLLMTIVENPSAGFGLPDHWMRMLLPQSPYTPGTGSTTGRNMYSYPVQPTAPNVAPTTEPTQPRRAR